MMYSCQTERHLCAQSLVGTYMIRWIFHSRQYEYQDIGIGTPSEVEMDPPQRATPPPVIEAGVPTPRLSFHLSIREVMGDDSSSTEGLAPGERILSQKVVWWPAVISAYKCEELPGDGVPSVRQVYEKLKSTTSPAARACVEHLLEQKGEAPVWQVCYVHKLCSAMWFW